MRIVPAGGGSLHEVELTELELVELPRLAQRLLPGQYELSVQSGDHCHDATLLQFAIDGHSGIEPRTDGRLLVQDSLGRVQRLSLSAEQQLWRRWHERVLVQHGITMPLTDEIAPAGSPLTLPGQQPSALRSPEAPPVTTELTAGMWSTGELNDQATDDDAELFRTTSDLRRLDSGLEEIGRRQRRSGRSARTRLALRKLKHSNRNDHDK